MHENKIFDTCPHCGEKLSPWQQVLLSVDRSLMCKNCWYRIVIEKRDITERADEPSQNKEEE